MSGKNQWYSALPAKLLVIAAPDDSSTAMQDEAVRIFDALSFPIGRYKSRQESRSMFLEHGSNPAMIEEEHSERATSRSIRRLR